MQAFGLGFVCAAFLFGGAEAGSPARVETLLQHAARLEPDEQQRFLLWIEARLNRACAVVLTPAQAARAQAALQTRLRQPKITWNELGLLLNELDRREQQAVEQLAYQYRRQTFRTFRNAPETYERRQAWRDVYAAWQTAGSPMARQQELLDWLTEGIHRSSLGTVGELPRAPCFEPVALASLLPHVQGPPTPDSAASEPTTAFQPSDRSPLHAPATAAPPRPEVPGSELLKPAAVPIPKRMAARIGGSPCQTPMNFAEQMAAAWSTVAPPRNVGLGAAPKALACSVVRPPRRTPLSASTFSGVGDAIAEDANGRTPAMVIAPASENERTSGEDVPELAGQAAGRNSPEPAAAEPTALANRVASSAEHTTLLTDRPVLPVPRILLEERLPQVAPPTRASSVAGSLPVATGISRETPQATRTPRTSPIDADASLRPETAATHAPRHAIHVNLQELRFRIGGTNMALRALEAELSESHQWSAGELTPLMDRLNSLTRRVVDLRLFREIVPEEARRMIDTTESPRPAITLLAERIAEARHRTTGDAYQGTETERRAELIRLDDLSRRLAEIAGLLAG